MDDQISERATRAGVATRYIGLDEKERVVPTDTIQAVLEAMGTEDVAHEPDRRLPRYLVVNDGRVSDPDLTGDTPWELTFEDGRELEGRGALPRLPLGRHCLTVEGQECWLLSAPPVLPMPERAWGVTLPLYGLRGPNRGGLATYEDLAVAAETLGTAGAAFVGLNPVHAGFGRDPFLVSPYSPSHRRRLATQFIHVLGEPSGLGGPLIDYGAELPARWAALEAAYDVFEDSGAFGEFLARSGELTRFATFQSLAEVHGPTWDRWPEAYQDPDGPAVTAFARENRGRLRFHAWLQYQAEQQLSSVAGRAHAAGMAHGLYLDLAVGTHPHGAETWSDRRSFASGVSLGAPPDAFSEDGQNWSLAPFNPQELIASGFAPLAATLRTQMRFAGMLRVDHILGFERAFWVPDGAPGTYVTMPKDAMLAVLRIEATRAGCVVVGEDLGNVPDGLRADLAASGVLGCAVAMFEPDKDPAQYREHALASFGTHDLPTWIGWREGRDIDLRKEIGALDPNAHTAAQVDRTEQVAALVDQLDGEDDADAMHAHLARASSCLVALQIEDILDVADQPNLPGTTDEYPNWRRRLPVDVADWGEEPRLRTTGDIMRKLGR